MRTALQQLDAVLQLLDGRGWRRVRDTERFFVYSPAAGALNDSYELVVPRRTGSSDFGRAIENTIDALASFYQVPFASIEALLIPTSEVVSLRLQGEAFVGGAAPFPRFERMLEHLKRTISRAASFIVTDDPLVQRTPTSARNYVDECWFLQTARGSFVTRVALPTQGTFGGLQPTLFGRNLEKVEVVTALREVSALVGNRVLAGDDAMFGEEGVETIRQTASVSLLEEFGRLLRSPAAERLDLSFSRGGEQTVVSMPDLSERRLERLDAFVQFVREGLHADFELDVVGRVFEVRRSRKGNHSLIGLEAIVDDRPAYVTFRIEQASLHVMLRHLQTREPLRVRGRARRLRTQIRIEAEFQYEE